MNHDEKIYITDYKLNSLHENKKPCKDLLLFVRGREHKILKKKQKKKTFYQNQFNAGTTTNVIPRPEFKRKFI